MRLVAIILLLLLPHPALGNQSADKVLVIKSRSTLFLLKDGKVLNKFHAAFGAHPKGRKQREGDQRTPEGWYILDYKKADSDFYKAIHISYPNAIDRRKAGELGVDPGGAIMIHGQKPGYEGLSGFTGQFNWTDGCIAVSNRAMDEIWAAVGVGTPIEIKP